jgi:hypothetical protein
MSKSPPSLKPALSKAAIAGAVLAVLAIILFGVLWVVLGNAGLSQTPRLFAALCIPPGVIAAIIGVYILVARPYANKNQQTATKQPDEEQ